ncbi:MAG TPA: PAS domain-containing sensor histidine kinase [Planctomycetota bacterium]|nr:PAS domain-containing sensor histidine kinase [Planctomycetota bacterium]
MEPTREELERVIGSFPEAMLVCDPDGHIVVANDQACALTGYRRDDLLSKKLDDLADPRDATPASRLLPALRGDATLDLETEVRFKDGSTSLLQLLVRPLPVGSKPHSLIRLARRRMDERLAQDPEFMRALLQTPGALLLTLGDEGKICFASPAFQALTGLDGSEIRGRHAWDLIADPGERDALRQTVAAPETSPTLQLTWRTPDGSGARILWTPTKLGAHVVLVGQEVPPPRKATRRALADGQTQRELERRIGELTAQLEEVRSDHEALTYTLAHDLRAPLRAMSGLSDTLIEDFADQPLGETGKDYALRIGKSAQRMDALIDALLVFHRIGRSAVTLEPLRLDSIVADVLATFTREIRLRGASIDVGVGALEAVADRPMLHLILTHLISNALKFVAPGSAPRVSIRATRAGDRVRLGIEDHGIGIPAEYLGLIFGVFQRLNKAEAYAGTGMGLAIVQRATDRMDGRVGLESEPGKGSRFWIELLAADGP